MTRPPVDILVNAPNLVSMRSRFHTAQAQYLASTELWGVWVDNQLVRSYTDREPAINEALRLCSEPCDMGEEPIL